MSKTPDLAAIRKRLEEATPGPWEFAPGDSYQAFPVVRSRAGYEFLVFDVDEDSYVSEYPGCAADAAFIAHAPTDIATLLEHTDRLQSLVDTLTVYAPPPGTPQEGGEPQPNAFGCLSCDPECAITWAHRPVEKWCQPCRDKAKHQPVAQEGGEPETPRCEYVYPWQNGEVSRCIDPTGHKGRHRYVGGMGEGAQPIPAMESPGKLAWDYASEMAQIHGFYPRSREWETVRDAYLAGVRDLGRDLSQKLEEEREYDTCSSEYPRGRGTRRATDGREHRGGD